MKLDWRACAARGAAGLVSHLDVAAAFRRAGVAGGTDGQRRSTEAGQWAVHAATCAGHATAGRGGPGSAVGSTGSAPPGFLEAWWLRRLGRRPRSWVVAGELVLPPRQT
jgi:hypothetical protein